MDQRGSGAVAPACVALIAGCGGSPPDGAAKARIRDAILSVELECTMSPADRDPVRIEQNVDLLVKEADKAWDATFTIGNFRDTTMPKLLGRTAGRMDAARCEPDQAKRLRD